MKCDPVHRSVCLGVLAAVVLTLFGTVAKGGAQSKKLPLRRVVLFSAGVGFFQHDGEIEGDQLIEMEFDAGDINDLLKSLVVEDRGDGTVSRVTYGSRKPVHQILQSFAIDLTQSPTLTDLLVQLRGRRISVESEEPLEGTVVGVEIRTRQVNNEMRRTEFLNLLTDKGIQSVSIDSVEAVKLLDEDLDEELTQALSLVGQLGQREIKTIQIQFRGEEKRPAMVGYVRQCPVWKISYRLVLSESKDPWLQGWAIVENSTDQDWESVGLTLVSGRPVSFVTELYEPLYVQRPHVMPELHTPAAPRLHARGHTQRLLPGEFPGGEMGGAGGGAMGMGAGAGGGMAGGYDGGGFGAGGGMGRMGGGYGGMGGGMGGGFGGGFGGMGGFGDVNGEAEQEPTAAADKQLDVADSVRTQVAGEEVGELFQYEIELPVTVGKDQSAMLPIVNQDVKTEKCSIYNADVYKKHPMNGLRLINTTDLHLMQGPMTLFDGSAFAGDARLRDIPPGGSQLVSYALDLDVDVDVTRDESQESLTAVRLVDGTLVTTDMVRRTSNYAIDNGADREKRVIIEQEIDADYELKTRDALDESTQNLYRFALTVQPESPFHFQVQEEKTVESKQPLSALDTVTLHRYLVAEAVPETVKEKLRQLARLRREIEGVTADIAAKDEQVRNLGAAQSRIRENMKVLDRTSELYQEYVQSLGAQEETLKQLNKEIVELKASKRELEQKTDSLSTEPAEPPEENPFSDKLKSVDGASG
ncbi:MAG: hypothetical protein ACODAD_08855 [Planctomycetota bacterium]